MSYTPRGRVLKRVIYGPDGAGASLITYANSTTSFIDIDATNLHAAFVAPHSGRVVVTFHALGQGVGTWLQIRLRDAVANAVIPHTQMSLIFNSSGRAAYRIPVSLTAGQSYDIVPQFRPFDVSQTARVFAGGDEASFASGPAVLEVVSD